MKVLNGKVSSLAPINLLFKKKAFKDHHQPTLKYHPQILPLTNNNLRQFSTEFNKQLNNLVTEDDNKNVWPREHVLNFYNFINPRFTSAKYFESQELEMSQLIQRIKQEQQDDSNKPLPMEIFKGLVERPCFVLADEILKMISQDKYDIIPNKQEMKRVALLFNVMRANYSTIIIKAFIQEWFNYHETCSPPIAYGMNINGKDITQQCQISNLNTIIENQILYLIESKIPTRETLMCLVTLIMATIQRRDMKKEVSKLIMKFIELYPIVKSRYTTVSNNDTNKEIDSYWNEVLGKVYTEDEFDWYLDLETDLPIHLGGMFNIFTEFIQIYNISNPNTEKIRKIFKDEQCKSPKNPYIPLLNVLTTYDMKMADECLRILSESKAFSRINDLKRIELKNAIFTNEKPKQERIKDLKLSPVLLIKVKDKVQDLKNADLETSLYLEQVEYYSRILTNSELLVIKFLNEFKQKRHEKALEIYKVLYKSFQEYTEPMTFFKVTNLAGKVMAELGQYEDCISVIGKLKDKYGNENAEWEKLLQHYKREISKRNSK